jgi:uncharacterized repeat protein (TIGR04138 family)
MDFYKKVEGIVDKDRRYLPDVYEFVMQALLFTQKQLRREGHLTARELLDGIRELGLNQYGPMVKTVFSRWGVKTTGDFGEIVFNMVENGLMGKTDNDSREDFQGVYDFDEAFDVKDRFRLDR